MNQDRRECSLNNKVALVTGAAKRVGRAIALELADAGARVAVHYHTSASAAEETVERAGGGSALFQADLRQPRECAALITSVKEAFGRIDVLVNNAALFGRTPFAETTEEEWDRFQEVNLKSAFFLSQAAAAVMDEGVVINIADSAGVTLWPGYIAYSISKSGLITLTQGLARALAPAIRVNAVLPGPVLPPEGEEGDEEAIKTSIQNTAMKRMGTPGDVAKAVRYLVAEGSYITGAILPVDGGRHLVT